jgi:hypothetical protein
MIFRKEEEPVSLLYAMTEQNNPRETLKNIVSKRLGEDETKQNASKTMSNELHMVRSILLTFRK